MGTTILFPLVTVPICFVCYYRKTKWLYQYALYVTRGKQNGCTHMFCMLLGETKWFYTYVQTITHTHIHKHTYVYIYNITHMYKPLHIHIYTNTHMYTLHTQGMICLISML